MKIGIIGSGQVARALGTALAAGGHDVKLGTRDPGKLSTDLAGTGATAGTNAEAAAHGGVVLNVTAGTASLAALSAAGAANLDGKVLIDVANPLDFSKGMPPSLSVCNTDSLAEQIQRAFPDAKVVKALNTVNADLMVNPAALPGEHDIFVCGNDAGARGKVTEILRSFGWRNIVDLGDITAARGQEMFLPLWLRLYGSVKSPMFNVHVVGRK